MQELEHNIDLTEFNKLKDMLAKAGIPFEEYHRTYFKGMDHHQLVYPSEEYRKSDVVIGFGTYGWKQGLLEQMGLLETEACEKDVQGWLNAEEVFQRWKNDYLINP